MMNALQVAQMANVLRMLDPVVAQTVLDELDFESQQAIGCSMSQEPNNSTCADQDAADRLAGSLVRTLEVALSVQRQGTDCCSANYPDSAGQTVPSNSGAEAILSSSSDAELISVLRDEYPQTAAICLASLAPDRAAALLGSLEEVQRIELLTRLNDLSVRDDSVVREICLEATQRTTALRADVSEGAAKARAILDRIPIGLRQDLWSSLAPGEVQRREGTTDLEDVRESFLKTLEQDAALTSLEFDRVCRDQWSVVDPLVDCVTAETLYRASQGLDFAARQAVYDRLPDSIQLQINLLASANAPVVVSEIHAAQVEILRRALESGSYQLAVWHRQKHISVAA